MSLRPCWPRLARRWRLAATGPWSSPTSSTSTRSTAIAATWPDELAGERDRDILNTTEALYREMEAIEDRIIAQALRLSRGNKKEAARLLRVNRTTLLEKLKRKRALVDDEALAALEKLEKQPAAYRDPKLADRMMAAMLPKVQAAVDFADRSMEAVCYHAYWASTELAEERA